MQYFTKDYIDFMTELAFNNEKSWFEANKKRYETHVKEPFQQFAEDLIAGIHEFDPDMQIDPKRAVYRIYRDVRFSKDKTPYKTYMGMGIGRSKNDYGFPGYTVGMGVDNGLSFAGGMYAPEKDQLLAIRRAIKENPKPLTQIATESQFAELWGQVIGDKNKVLPAEFKAAAKNNDWLWFKQWVYWKAVDFGEITREDLLEYLLDHFRAGAKLNAYFKRFVD